MLIFAAAMLALNRYWPVLPIISSPWSRLGWCLMAIAPVTPVAAMVQFRNAHTTVDPRKPETATTLVTSGVYGWTRNPMYLGLSMLLIGWAITLGALSPFLGPVCFILLIQRVQILAEERALRERFGQDYDRYCDHVHRWFGRNFGKR
jgi:protein-S-isoprenylcysteine O-methyltransferase Ste14